MKIYLANGLFSLADYNLNAMIAKEIREQCKEVELFVPQEAPINDKESFADSNDIFAMDYKSLKESELMVAVIDGVEIDSGVACEIGIARALGIPVIGLYTDVRQQGTTNKRKVEALLTDSVENQFMYRNLFVVGAIKSNGVIVSTIEELIQEITSYEGKKQKN